MPSFNEIYGSKHWTHRKKLKDDMGLLFKEKLRPHKDVRIDRFTVGMAYNSRLDPDNTTFIMKILVDTMRGMGIVSNDTKRYYRGLSVSPDESLSFDQYIFTINEV